jgi:hypothetical protein
MAEIVTLELSDRLAHQVHEVALATQRRIEEVLLEWIERVVAESPVELLPDDQVLAWCEMQMPPEQQEQLDTLLIRNREEQLNEVEKQELDELMCIYRQGLVRKARAWKVAVERGLKAPLN